ncbi:hypothetical protein [Ruania halotolerans]|uniref:hypothetical protein n=1 Tax=Ruania halotolerans TaxID=2897773 RepID=UPI001E48F24F|nr:hypothetical protein [Ruania halotolerans]UFU08279.1 hypothetical protein LQF10_09365 [Ruania halotolerans]
MIWLAVWTVLVLGACAVLFLIARHLWRGFKALMEQARHSAEVMERLNDAVAELEAQARSRTFSPHLAATASQREEWRHARAANVAARAERVRERRSRTLDRWRAIGMPL